jgi:hypothetical protein
VDWVKDKRKKKKTQLIEFVHVPAFFSVRGKFFKHDFYLLNWNKKESRDIISHIFDGSSLVDSNSLMAYRINSIQNGSNNIDKVEPIPLHPSHAARDLEKRIIDLDVEEKRIIREILQSYTNQNKWAKQGSQLVERRNKILATLILACAKYYGEYLLLERDRPWSYDFLVSLLREPLRLFDPPLRPYAKVYEIMQLLGF